MYLNPLMQENKGLVTLNPFLPHPELSYYPSCSPYIPVILTRIVFENWELLKLVIISFILITLTFDSRVIP